MSPERVEVFLRKDGRWAWRRVSANGQVVASDAGQGYSRKVDCMARAAKSNPDAKIKVVASERFTAPPEQG